MSDTEFSIETGRGGILPAPSGAARRAVIDIGTNSIKLLVAEVDGAEVRPVFETSEQTRLGRGFYRTQQLQSDAIHTSLQAVRKFAEQARSLDASAIRLIATSAVRDARNSAEFTAGIRSCTGLDVEVISGEQEADWAFAGVSSLPRLSGHPLLVLDVGGGSTEFVIGQKQHVSFKQSYPLGTVRLMEQLELSDPPTAGDFQRARDLVSVFLQDKVKPSLQGVLPLLEPVPSLVGTGGTPAILVRIHLGLSGYDRERIESTRLTLADVGAITTRLWSLDLQARKIVPGLPADRADVILSGAMIYLCVMKTFGFQHLDVSTRGLRFAVVAAMGAP